MFNSNQVVTFSAATALVVGMGAPVWADCGSCAGTGAAATATHHDDHDHTIVELAAEAGSFKTLLAAAKAAGLAETLSGDGPFTVFAPTDEAFAKLPAGTVESLLKPENKNQLRSILLYHVVAGRVPATTVIASSLLKTAATGEFLTVQASANGVQIDGATVLKTDLEASNGVIHVIDRVLIPESKPSIVDVASEAGSFNTLLAAAQAAGLASTLDSDGPFTVFAPTDEAFAKLPAGTIEMLLMPEHKDKLTSILLYHVVPGTVTASTVVESSLLKTAEAGKFLTVETGNRNVKIDNAMVVKTDISAGNGIIHVIDQVVLPQDKPSIVDVATESGSFETLLAAASAAGLVETLRTDGPFTVFAPTDEAFAKLPAGTVEMLLKPENKAALQEVLLYHVVSGKKVAAQVLAQNQLDALAGGTLMIRQEGGAAFINNAQIVVTDQLASNGVIHVIDAVLIPNAKESSEKSAVRPIRGEETRSAKGTDVRNEFEPILEAELPMGFPQPGPVGEIVVKNYPTYRAAVADFRDGFFGQSSPFMDLFRHIKKNEIAMTAPVEQVMAEDRQSMKTMAFLYSDPALGSTGVEKKVSVQDLSAMTVVSIGIRGRSSDKVVAEARDELHEWVNRNGDYRVAGPVRVLGYNSPFIAARNRYSEVQIPVTVSRAGI